MNCPNCDECSECGSKGHTVELNSDGPEMYSEYEISVDYWCPKCDYQCYQLYKKDGKVRER